jgi:hypothetical protein
MMRRGWRFGWGDGPGSTWQLLVDCDPTRSDQARPDQTASRRTSGISPHCCAGV